MWFIIITILFISPNIRVYDFFLSNIPHFDKLVHFGFFFINGFLLITWLKSRTRLKFFRISFLVLIITIFYGGIIEIVQHNYIPSRSGDIIDFLVDILGVLTMLLLYNRLFNKILIK